MKKFLKKTFVPHEDNQFKPHFLREKVVLAITVIVILAFVLTVAQTLIITKTNLLATIFPSVLVDLANAERIENGSAPLTINQTLVQSAQLKAHDMAAKSYFAHNSPEGLTPWYWFKQSGYNFMLAGENLAVNFSESVDVNRAWMNSPTHKDNILRQDFTEVGIALAQGNYQGRPTTFVVQHFGRPKPLFDVAPEAPVVPAVEPPVADLPPAEKPEEAEAVLAKEAEKETIKVVEEFQTKEGNQTFVAVKDAGARIPASQENTGVALGQEKYSSYFERLLLNPTKTLSLIYLILAVLIIATILLMVGIEIGRQHPKHIIYGILLLILILLFFYLYREILFNQVTVL